MDINQRPLGPRTQQIAEMIARGLGRKQIAAELGISEKTVQRLVSNAARRLAGPGSPRYKLMVYILQHHNGNA